MNDFAGEYGIGIPSVSSEGESLARGRRKHRPQRRTNPDRLPPNAPDMEQGVLGCVLLAPADCLGECIEKFRGKDVFYDLRHQTIFHVLLEMYEKQEAIDIILLQQKLKDKGVLEQVGGIAYLSALPDKVPSAANLSYYIAIVWEKFLFRKAVETFQEGIEAVYGFEGNAEDLLVKVESQVSALTESHTTASEEHIKVPLRRVMTELEDHSYRRGSMQLRGLPTGPPGNYLDKVVGGVRRKYYFVLAGRPGSGKTSLGMNLVEYWACDFPWWEACTEAAAVKVREHGGETYFNEKEKQWHQQRKGIPVVVFSIEMDGDSLTERLLFGRAGVTSAEFRQGFAEKNAPEKLTAAMGQLAKSNIYIDASSGQTIGQIAAKARRMVKQYGLKNPPPDVPPLVFVLDYIQLVEMEGSDGFDRVKEITKISRKIMSLKKQLECPWIVLAQMNRNIETAERDRKPVLSDLKDCGALEQDSDIVLFTYKTPRKELERVPENGGASQEEIIEAVCNQPGDDEHGRPRAWPWSKVPYRVDLVVPKNRHGPTGDAQMVFCKNLCRFEDWHLWKLKHGVEGRKAGESIHIVEPPEDLK